MATYECAKCGMAVNASCAKCDLALIDDVLITDDGREVQISKCTSCEGKIKIAFVLRHGHDLFACLDFPELSQFN